MISAARVAELRDEVGEDDFAEIVALFLSEAEAMLDALRAAAGEGEAAALLHALKGCALNLGFDALAELCREGGDAGPWEVRAARLAHVFARSREELAALG